MLRPTAAATVIVFAVLATTAKRNEFYEAFLNDFLTWKHDVNPEGASLSGMHEYDAHLTDSSLAGAEKVRQKCMEFSGKAKAILAAGVVSGLEAHYVDLVGRECQTVLSGLEVGGNLLAPVNFLEGVQFTMQDTFNRSSFFRLDSLSDYTIALQRLMKVPAALDGVRETLEEGVRRNVTYSVESMSRVEKQFSHALVSDPSDSGFYTPFAKLDKQGFNGAIVAALQTKAKSVISDEILPSLKNLGDYIQGEYMEHLRPAPGISNVANGDAFYKLALEYHTSVRGLGPQDVHDLGLEEVERLREGVLKVASKLGKGDLGFREFLSEVREDPEQQFATSEELLKHVRSLVRDRINPKMSMVIPEEYLTDKLYSLKVEPVPPGGGGIAYYYEGNRDGTRNGTYYINVDNLSAFKRFELVPLSLHEGNPGHHFDLTVFRFARGDAFPGFLHAYGYGHYASSPAATPIYTAFQEGWGLYTEFLGYEMGLYEDPYDELGFFSWNLLRAGRLVVDTGIHALGWSRERAVRYLFENTAMSLDNVETEVDRYTTWPGQATAYKVGEMAIRKMRRKAEAEAAAAGVDFDVRAFHRDLLACRGPLDTVEECMQLVKKV